MLQCDTIKTVEYHRLSDTEREDAIVWNDDYLESYKIHREQKYMPEIDFRYDEIGGIRPSLQYDTVTVVFNDGRRPVRLRNTSQHMYCQLYSGWQRKVKEIK